VVVEAPAQSRPKHEQLQAYFAQYDDVPREVIIKEDVLRVGIAFTEAALRAAAGCRRKSYYIFSYNIASFDELTQGEAHRAPEEIRMSNGPFALRPTVVRVQVAAASPYTVDVVDNALTLLGGGEPLADVEYLREPACYAQTFDDGTSYGELVACIGWGQRTLTTVYRHCNYWDVGRQCLYCDLNANVEELRRRGHTMTMLKDPEQVAEVHRELFVEQPDDEPRRQIVQITGGSVLDPARGIAKDEDFYLEYVRAVRDKLGGRWPITLQTVAKDRDTCRRLRDAGVDVHHANIEVWDKHLFGTICPGKTKFVGRDEWVRRVLESVDVFGEGNVLPTLVAGVEMSQPHGFTDVDEAVASTAEGLDYLMSHGVVPRLNHWVIEPLSALAGNQQPPLDYFIKIDRAWYPDTLWGRDGQPIT
jgi:hypothetical protein